MRPGLFSPLRTIDAFRPRNLPAVICGFSANAWPRILQEVLVNHCSVHSVCSIANEAARSSHQAGTQKALVSKTKHRDTRDDATPHQNRHTVRRELIRKRWHIRARPRWSSDPRNRRWPSLRQKRIQPCNISRGGPRKLWVVGRHSPVPQAPCRSSTVLAPSGRMQPLARRDSRHAVRVHRLRPCQCGNRSLINTAAITADDMRTISSSNAGISL